MPAPAESPDAPPPRKARRARTPKNAFALPVRAPDAPAIPYFEPVPRFYNRHDGWTPERQRAFIGALADTGCVRRAARLVNMAQTNCYTLRRAPGAEGFARAWDAALGQGVRLLKDIAFERAIEGTLEPVIAGGKLIGHRRKFNDALLMFCLRHYGEDAGGRRTTINYFSTRASAGTGAGTGPGIGDSRSEAGAEAAATTVTTVITGRNGAGTPPETEALLRAFEGVPLDPQAEAEIMAALHAAAARAREDQEDVNADGYEGAEVHEHDPELAFVELPASEPSHHGNYLSGWPKESEEFPQGEDRWQDLGAAWPQWKIDLEEGRLIPGYRNGKRAAP